MSMHAMGKKKAAGAPTPAAKLNNFKTHRRFPAMS